MKIINKIRGYSYDAVIFDDLDCYMFICETKGCVVITEEKTPNSNCFKPDGGTVAQKHEMGCGVACVAMFLGVSYDEAFERFFSDFDLETQGLNMVFVREAVQDAGVDLRVYVADEVPDCRAILVVKSLNAEDEGHYVYWDGETVRDPSPLRRYETPEMLRGRIRFVMVERRR